MDRCCHQLRFSCSPWRWACRAQADLLFCGAYLDRVNIINLNSFHLAKVCLSCNSLAIEILYSIRAWVAGQKVWTRGHARSRRHTDHQGTEVDARTFGPWARTSAGSGPRDMGCRGQRSVESTFHQLWDCPANEGIEGVRLDLLPRAQVK